MLKLGRLFAAGLGIACRRSQEEVHRVVRREQHAPWAQADKRRLPAGLARQGMQAGCQLQDACIEIEDR